MEEVKKIALFIDADNVSSKYGKLIMESLKERGEVFIRRIYGNWEKNSLHKWNDCILHYGLHAVHQIDFSSGKNATDMTLAIDAMDVLYKHRATTFAIVSNDSDFTPLAVRLREHGVSVIGIGLKESSVSFRNACNEFMSLDSLGVEEPAEAKKKAALIPADTAEIPTEEKLDDTDAHAKIAELERKIFLLEKKFSEPQWSNCLRLTVEENKNSALQNSPKKIAQKVIIKSLAPVVPTNSISDDDLIAEDIVSSEIVPTFTFSTSTTKVDESLKKSEKVVTENEVQGLTILKPSLPVDSVTTKTSTANEGLDTSKASSNSKVETTTAIVAITSTAVTNSTVSASTKPTSKTPATKTPTKKVATASKTAKTTTKTSTTAKTSASTKKKNALTAKTSNEKPATKDKSISVELNSEVPAQVDSQSTKSVNDDQKKIEREKALNERFVQCGQNGMRNPKKKMQQIHDVLRESAKLHGDKDGFVTLTFVGQDLNKKNLGFTVKDFGYNSLNEFIGDFPDLYELTHTKPRTFRYRCI